MGQIRSEEADQASSGHRNPGGLLNSDKAEGPGLKTKRGVILGQQEGTNASSRTKSTEILAQAAEWKVALRTNLSCHILPKSGSGEGEGRNRWQRGGKGQITGQLLGPDAGSNGPRHYFPLTW